MTNYFAENGRRIQIIGQFFLNDISQFWGLPEKCMGSGLRFICNLQAHVEATGWVSGKYSNQDSGGRIFGANSITNVALGDSVNARPAYLLQRLVNPCPFQRRFCNNFLCCRHQECLWFQYNQRNPSVNLRVRLQDDDRDDPVT